LRKFEFDKLLRSNSNISLLGKLNLVNYKVAIIAVVIIAVIVVATIATNYNENNFDETISEIIIDETIVIDSDAVIVGEDGIPYTTDEKGNKQYIIEVGDIPSIKEE